MATEILINDGGAPARILPFTAGSAVTAGDPMTLALDGEVDKVAAADVSLLGVALVGADSGTKASVVTGKGVTLNTLVSGTNVGLGQMLATNANGYLVSTSTAGNAVAVALETGTATTGLKKVLTA